VPKPGPLLATRTRGARGAFPSERSGPDHEIPSAAHHRTDAPLATRSQLTQAKSLSKSGSGRHYLEGPLDDQEWDQALEACYARVLRALIGACGSRERAEDGLQDALVAAWRPGVRERVQRPDAWLYRVALRKIGRARWRRRFEVRLTEGIAHDLERSLERVVALQLLQKLTPRQ